MTLRIGTGRPLGGYGKGYVSASELAGMLSDTEPLTRWAVLMSRAGKDPFRHRDEAGEVGNAMHAAIVAYLSGKPYTTILWDSPDVRAAEHAFHAWRVWWEAEDRGEPLYAEWPLVCPELGFAGTLDLIARRPDGRLWLYDWKGCETYSALTGEPKKSVWKPGHALQAGGYNVLWNRAPLAPSLALWGATIVYCPRDSGQAVAVDIEDEAWGWATMDAEALVPLVRRHRERSAYDALARPLPELEACDVGELDFGP